jgi:hypothetical protein
MDGEVLGENDGFIVGGGPEGRKDTVGDSVGCLDDSPVDGDMPDKRAGGIEGLAVKKNGSTSSILASSKRDASTGSSP